MSGGGKARRSTLFGAMFLGSILFLFLACSSSAATTAPRGNSGGESGLPAEPPAPTAGPAQPLPEASAAAGSDSGAIDAGTYIVRTGSLEIEVTDVDAAVSKARDLVTAAGGYESASDESSDGDAHKATITYRIPVDKWQDSITGLRAIGTKVITENTKADEVTAQVVDLNARIDNERAAEASIRDIMSRAGTIDDVLNVQTRLQSVQEDIERMVAQQQDLTGQAALGTLAVTWGTPVVAAVAEVQSGWNLGTEVDHALAQTVSAGQALASFLIWFALVGVPVFGPIVLIGLLVIWFARRWQRAHPQPVYANWQPVPEGYSQSVPQAWQPGAVPPASGVPPVAPGHDPDEQQGPPAAG